MCPIRRYIVPAGTYCERTPVSCFRCMCSPGYTGQNCENKYVPCDPSPCLNDGLCRQVDSLSYECQCPPGVYHV
uniref:EGF-like domain-containing protein n=1 Tax=Timema tahoe TaxID=61484 RepID=A0A7R9IPF6_9NEOP|nr:unnamed protein product [Timema tahoe]